MKHRTTLGRMAVLAGVLFATVTSAYANHAAVGKGAYAVAPQLIFQFHFVVATAGLNFVQAEWTDTGGSISLQTTTISGFTISDAPAGRMVTITGEMVSTTILGAGSVRQAFAELVPFTAIGVDTATSGSGDDLLALTLEYRADQAQGPLFASLGFGVCQATTCTITFEGPVETGDIFVHTAGGE